MSFINNTSGAWTPMYVQPYYSSGATTTTSNIQIMTNGPITVQSSPPPRALTAVEQLFADVDGVCALGRAA